MYLAVTLELQRHHRHWSCACSGPIYPAKQVLVEVGHSPSTMRTVGGPYTMACTDTPQMFLLPPSLENAAVGKNPVLACYEA